VSVVFGVLYLVTLVFLLLLMGRLVLEWVQVFARDWRPKGLMLVVAEVCYTVTDPPIRAVRRVLPPLRIGRVALDLGFLVVAIACSILLRVFGALAVAG
jgi:YggT family protein